jgi:hypothetical protein
MRPFSIRSVFLILLLSSACAIVRADGVSFNSTITALTLTSGSQAIFSGTVTNGLTSGEALPVSSFFFDFNNVDLTGLDFPLQILPQGGDDFTIPGESSSSVVELFSVDLLPGALAGHTYTFDATVQAFDAAGDTFTGNTVTFALTVSPGTAPVPEPSALFLLCAGLCGTVLLLRK